MWLYIMASGWNGTLYVGVTNSLSRRIDQHREGRGSEFVRNYGVVHLVYAEKFESVRDAIEQEKRVKRWRRDRKIALIESGNPNWRDLYDTVHLD
ncbi:GIY-YIG nuclease family protein [Bosea sp. PAMC 26642]|uniref:GIY-YIG nuclease family protein n=1 Tax=Bosea sp. (strain PAMC 26642) TaxID=1792307 RepID=UPI0007702201|nr:GIY-YIG nuclease family protein [Bosea sp. PAMC 26642]AMJ60222.1 excinuclease ABC subunit C [Bosea sp. PAMC 26642]